MAIINFVRDYERVAKFQLGRYVGMKGPGLVWIIPIIQSGHKVDLREQYFPHARASLRATSTTSS